MKKKSDTVTEAIDKEIGSIDPEELVRKAKKNAKKKLGIEEPVQVGKIITEDFLVEQVKQDNKLLFATYDRLTGEISYSNSISQENHTYIPIQSKEALEGIVALPSKATEYGTKEELIEEIKEFINKWVDIEEKHFLLYATYNILLSWLYERFHTLNYLRFRGEYGTGKSRALDVIGGLHYKSQNTSGAITPAVIFRVIDKWKGTLIIDEADLKQSDQNNEIIKILNQGYEKGRYVLRTNKEKNYDVEYFDTFCPKVLATRGMFDDKALESRCLTKIMKTTRRKDIPPNLNEEYHKEINELRNKLLMWRFKNFYTVDARAGEEIDFGDIEPRLRQVSTGYVSMLLDDKNALEGYISFLREYQQELIEEKSNSWEGRIVKATIELLLAGNKRISAGDIIEQANLRGRNKELIHPRAISKYTTNLGYGKTVIDREGNDVKKIYVFDYNDLFVLAKRWISDKDLLVQFERNFVTMVTDVTQQATLGKNRENINKKTEVACSVTKVTSVTELQNNDSKKHNKIYVEFIKETPSFMITENEQTAPADWGEMRWVDSKVAELLIKKGYCKVVNES